MCESRKISLVGIQGRGREPMSAQKMPGRGKAAPVEKAGR